MSDDATKPDFSPPAGLGPLPEPTEEWDEFAGMYIPSSRYTDVQMRAYALHERKRLLNELLRMHAEANGRHNYYLCAAVELGVECFQ